MYSAEDICESKTDNYYMEFVKSSIIEPARLAINRFSTSPTEGNLLNLGHHKKLISTFLSTLQNEKQGKVVNSIDLDNTIQLLTQFLTEVDVEMVSINTVDTVSLDCLYMDVIREASAYNNLLEGKIDLSPHKTIISYNKIQLEGLIRILINRIENIKKGLSDPESVEDLKKQLQSVETVYDNFLNIIDKKFE